MRDNTVRPRGTSWFLPRCTDEEAEAPRLPERGLGIGRAVIEPQPVWPMTAHSTNPTATLPTASAGGGQRQKAGACRAPTHPERSLGLNQNQVRPLSSPPTPQLAVITCPGLIVPTSPHLSSRLRNCQAVINPQSTSLKLALEADMLLNPFFFYRWVN